MDSPIDQRENADLEARLAGSRAGDPPGSLRFRVLVGVAEARRDRKGRALYHFAAAAAAVVLLVMHAAIALSSAQSGSAPSASAAHHEARIAQTIRSLDPDITPAEASRQARLMEALSQIAVVPKVPVHVTERS